MSGHSASILIASDVHLRLDRPDRGRRLARWVETLDPTDPLILAGDLCDFWFASRQLKGDPFRCEGLRALAEFRTRGGSITILLGNHDGWLGPFYERTLGARIADEPFEFEAHGLRIQILHGHRMGSKESWKGLMEGRAFLRGFALLPSPLASGLKEALVRANARNRTESTLRHLRTYREYAEGLTGRVDLLIVGHIHEPIDEVRGPTRLVVLGSWIAGTSYLRIDESGVSLMGSDGTGID